MQCTICGIPATTIHSEEGYDSIYVCIECLKIIFLIDLVKMPLPDLWDTPPGEATFLLDKLGKERKKAQDYLRNIDISRYSCKKYSSNK